MSKPVQGVLEQCKLAHLFIQFILLLTFFSSPVICAETAGSMPLLSTNLSSKHQVAILFTADSAFQSDITQALTEIFSDKLPELQVSPIQVDAKTTAFSLNTFDLIIAIGNHGIKNAKQHFPNTDKLLLTTDSTADSNNDSLKPGSSHNAVLHIVQPYCRQIQFIKLFNDQWKVISVLYDRENYNVIKSIQQCAVNKNIKTYALEIDETAHLTDEIKNALTHSDLLLAIPNKKIYNSKTVKNILLTSYRHRKPVFAFSHNFVNAGALASIYSTAEQIAQDAGSIIESYYKNEQRFTNAINFPVSYNISINKQVLRALDLPLPDTSRLKQILEHSETDNKGNLQ